MNKLKNTFNLLLEKLQKRDWVFAGVLGLIIGVCEPLVGDVFWWLKFVLIAICLNIFYSLVLKKVEEKISWKKFFILVFSFFYGWFFISTSWVASSALVNGLPSYMVIGYFLIRLFFPIVLAGVKSLPFYLFWKYQKVQSEIWKVVLFAIVFALSELFLTFVWQGWPYEYLAYNWFNVKSVMQIVSLPFVSVFDLSLITLFAIFSFRFIGKDWIRQGAVSIQRGFVCLILPLLLVFIFGFFRLSGYDKYKFEMNLDLYLFQGNAPSYVKYTPEVIAKRKDDLIEMASKINLENDKDKTSVFVFYESALQYYIGGSNLYLEDISAIIPEEGYLITGHLASAGFVDNNTGEFKRNYYNSISVFDDGGNSVDTYDKKKLVAFGEYMPWFVKWFIPKNQRERGFSKGEGFDKLFFKDRLFFEPKICHEITFPFWNLKWDFWKKNKIEKFAILNVLNEGWFGEKVVDKHYIISAFQAVDKNKIVLRIANTGLTGAIDKYGFPIKGNLVNDNFESVDYLDKNVQSILKISL